MLSEAIKGSAIDPVAIDYSWSAEDIVKDAINGIESELHWFKIWNNVHNVGAVCTYMYVYALFLLAYLFSSIFTSIQLQIDVAQVH